jgi:hypothetical protein
MFGDYFMRYEMNGRFLSLTEFWMRHKGVEFKDALFIRDFLYTIHFVCIMISRWSEKKTLIRVYCGLVRERSRLWRKHIVCLEQSPARLIFPHLPKEANAIPVNCCCVLREKTTTRSQHASSLIVLFVYEFARLNQRIEADRSVLANSNIIILFSISLRTY